ncbi:hypothetical protein GSI_04448 [Ganoderma sinense ZZ0214-1]|uniref:Uncharacterized protein n=1 Tax=Ganoderma sinense ZZ0214-1 TaxID=1077348 RepID=A0A2G8RYS1_9APHY|nr:hypothetical protein GSI_11237 [Ganoderma sinense ZZ0214-1]PIL32999.1 hypothetical protein GSI_04448 [Ganoderma sinense ZZ0214-1]
MAPPNVFQILTHVTTTDAAPTNFEMAATGTWAPSSCSREWSRSWPSSASYGCQTNIDGLRRPLWCIAVPSALLQSVLETCVLGAGGAITVAFESMPSLGGEPGTRPATARPSQQYHMKTASLPLPESLTF